MFSFSHTVTILEDHKGHVNDNQEDHKSHLNDNKGALQKQPLNGQ